IFGHDPGNAFLSEFRDRAFEATDCLKVGNPHDGVTREAIKAELSQKVGPDTQIELCIHGKVSRNGHSLSLSTGNALEDTGKLLTYLDGLTPAPLQIFLRSCYAGEANACIIELKPGSTLITFASSDEESTETLDLNFSPGLSPERKFLVLLRKLPQKSTFSKV